MKRGHTHTIYKLIHDTHRISTEQLLPVSGVGGTFAFARSALKPSSPVGFCALFSKRSLLFLCCEGPTKWDCRLPSLASCEAIPTVALRAGAGSKAKATALRAKANNEGKAKKAKKAGLFVDKTLLCFAKKTFGFYRLPYRR